MGLRFLRREAVIKSGVGEKDQSVPDWEVGPGPGPEITVLLDSVPNSVGLLDRY